MKQPAQRPDFRPFHLAAKATFDITNRFNSLESSNVIAKIQGQDAVVGDEAVIYSAHWDHFGKVVKDGVTGIYSGAVDNASGCAAILEIARAYLHLPERARRTAIFFFPTLEERGLLGAQYYVKNPVVPLEQTLAIMNIDAMNVWGRTRKVVSIARGHSSLDDVLAECAQAQDRSVISDLEPEKGFFFRSDHLEFLRKGVPAIFFLGPGTDFIDKPADFRDKKRLEYVTNDYHKTTDKIKPDWDLSGAVEDAQLIFSTGVAVSEAEHYPQWLASSEFRVPRGRLAKSSAS
jgi:Zn-dependent M28 family amino/carboxypeptidase